MRKKKPKPAPYPCNNTAGGGASGEGAVDLMEKVLR